MEISSKDIRFYPLGDTAVILQFEESISDQVQRTIFAVSHFLDEYSFEGLVEYVPAYTSVTLFYDPLLISYSEIVQNLGEMLDEIAIEEPVLESAILDIPVCYGGEMGPDLGLVARHCGLSEGEVILRHAQPDYLVHLIGFAPGFPYLGGMDPDLEIPRRESPRAVVPAGSVGIAGKQTGVYPLSTPGGWQIIGRTPLKLFDLDRTVPSLLKAGNKLRFVPITELEFERIANGY